MGHAAQEFAEARATSRTGRRPHAAAGPLLLAALFALLTAWSWGKWPDVLVDFGTELYVPWQLASGKVLYRDIACRQGPLPHYLNALWFALFGVSLRTLVLCNLAIFAGICALATRILQRTCGALAAQVACAVLLVVFGFSQYVGIGNYNYVTPYQHHQTHGLALGLLGILALARGVCRGSAPAWGAAGACLGLVFLTKLELFLPLAAASGVALAFLPLGGARAGAARAARVFVAAALLPPLLALALLGRAMPPEAALAGVLGNWLQLGGGLLAGPFYQRGAGLDDAAGNAARAVAQLAGLAAFAALALALERFLPRGRRRAWALAVGLAAFAAGSLPGLVDWLEVPRALPLSTLGLAAGLLALCARRRAEPGALERWLPLALWAVYALALLAKMGLAARIHHYGFALAMPATLLLVAALVAFLPAVLAPRTGGAVARAAALGAIAACALSLWARSEGFYREKTVAVGEGADRFLAAPVRGRAVAAALARLAGLVPPGATLLALPEGAGLNYWLRRESPTRFLLFLPPEIEAFGGEEALLREIRRGEPAVVALVARPSREFGVGPFGSDPRNGRELLHWVEAHYERVAPRAGGTGVRAGAGITLWKRRPRPREAPGA